MNSNRRKICFVSQVVLISFFLTYLKDTDSIYSVYIFCALFGTVAAFFNSFKPSCWEVDNHLPRRTRIIYLIFAIIYALSVVLANYQLWISDDLTKCIHGLLKATLTFFGGCTAAWNILALTDVVLQHKQNVKTEKKLNPLKIAAITFALSLIVDLLFLFLCNYPGNLSPDSLNQINQILTGKYSNHHPYWHTVIIGFFVKLGMHIFGDINAGVACYSVWQIVFMSFCFAYCVGTLYHVGLQKIFVIIVIGFYVLTPYNIVYSVTVWKDVPFAGAVLLMETALFRILKQIGKKKWLNYVTLILGSFGMCLWRSNGRIAFALILLVFFIFYSRENKKVSYFLTMVFGMSLILIHPALARMNVKQPYPVESLSIPCQQIARVVVDECQMAEDEKELLGKIIDVEKIPNVYENYISDPIKDLVIAKGNQEYLLEHKTDFLMLWIRLGLRNPGTYVKAWIDQTKGYWNGGYQYWMRIDYVHSNDLGIERLYSCPVISQVKDHIFSVFFNYDNVFALFRSIGLGTWIVGMCACLNVARRKWNAFFLTVPLMAIILTLLIATPVYSEFRYAYATFTSIPIVLHATLE